MVLALGSPFGGGRGEVMQARSMARVFLGALWGISLAPYIAAEIHFFSQYDPLQVGDFLREHSIYWQGLAASGFLIWL
jgi:hypothetical protein